MEQRIASRDNPAVKYACRLRDDKSFRASEGVFFAEGLRLCAELAKDLRPYKVYYLDSKRAEAEALGGELCEISKPVADKLSDTKSPQGIFALFPLPHADEQVMNACPRLLCLEHVQDPANVGTLIRSAAAFGFGGVVLSADSADPFSGKALRASMGAAGRVPVAVCDDLPARLAQLRESGAQVYAAALYRSRPLAEASPAKGERVAVVIGNEGRGLTDEAVAASSMSVRIPIADAVESLNAAAAGAVLLWHFRGEALR